MDTFVRALLVTFFAIVAGLACASGPDGDERPPGLNCFTGPLNKTYGQTSWVVYACDDSRSVVVLSDKGNPALPFYFIFYVKSNGEMKLYGEGSGKKSATKAAFDDLKLLTPSDVASLVKAAQEVPASGKSK